MRLFFIFIMVFTTSFSLFACTTEDKDGHFSGTQEYPGNPNNENASELPSTEGNNRCIVIFYSRTGNTKQIAQQIQTSLDCDILEVKPSLAYEKDYNTVLERVKKELETIKQGNYPHISTHMENFDGYETIFIGYPIWFGSMATPMQSFLYEHAPKLTGKHIALFATSGGSDISLSVKEAVSLCHDAEILNQALLIDSPYFSQIEKYVNSWLEQLNIHLENSDNMGSNTIKLTVNGRSFTATLVENSSTKALKEHLAQEDIDIRMSDYGNMEKVGSLGFSLPKNDTHTITEPGDLILYQGNSLVIYYDTNSWNFTRLGKVDGVSTRSQMLELLGGTGEVTVTLSLD